MTSEAMANRQASEADKRWSETHSDNGNGQNTERWAGRLLSIYPSLSAALAGDAPVNVSPGSWRSAADALDRMLPGEAAVLRDGGRVVDIAEATV